MTNVEMSIDIGSQRLLAALRGQRWRCFGAPEMAPQPGAPFDIFFATEDAAITVCSMVDYLDVDGEESPFAALSVEPGAPRFDEVANNGNLYFFHSGAGVTDILVVRDTISEQRDGTSTWRFTTDVGIVFVLTTAVIAVSKLGLHDEMLQVTVARSMDELVLPWIQRKWKDRRLISLGLSPCHQWLVVLMLSSRGCPLTETGQRSQCVPMSVRTFLTGSAQSHPHAETW